MKKTIEIDGKECELKEAVRESGGFAIHTDGGTFRMKPCKPKTGQSAFWMGLKGFVVELPEECPQRISRITFDEPNISEADVAEILACCLANRKEFLDGYYEQKANLERARERRFYLGEYMRYFADKKRKKVEQGYISDDFLIYNRNLKGQKIDPACLHKFKWAAEYMDESGQGEVVFFERLALDPLPKGYKNTRNKAKGGRKPAVQDATTRTAIVKECQKRIANGMRPTTAAKGVETWAKERFAETVGYKTILGYVKKSQNMEKKK